MQTSNARKYNVASLSVEGRAEPVHLSKIFYLNVDLCVVIWSSNLLLYIRAFCWLVVNLGLISFTYSCIYAYLMPYN